MIVHVCTLRPSPLDIFLSSQEYKHTKSSSDSTPSTPSTSVTSSVATMTQRLGELQEQSSVIELQNTIQVGGGGASEGMGLVRGWG